MAAAALHALNPSRTEALAVSLLGQHGVIKSESRDQTRVVAARYLGASGRSPEAIEALENAAKKWWWNSDELRSVADAGLSALRARGGAA